MSKIETARVKYEAGEIEFQELERIFFEEATTEQKRVFYETPVFDRPGVIRGLNKKQRDKEFDNLFEV